MSDEDYFAALNNMGAALGAPPAQQQVAMTDYGVLGGPIALGSVPLQPLPPPPPPPPPPQKVGDGATPQDEVPAPQPAVDVGAPPPPAPSSALAAPPAPTDFSAVGRAPPPVPGEHVETPVERAPGEQGG